MTATAVSRKYGTKIECDDFIGVLGEIVVDTTDKTLRVHDGETLGGTALAKADSSNVNTKNLATGANIVGGHIGKNLLYSDLTNLNNNAFSTPDQISEFLSDNYSMANKNGENIDTAGLTKSSRIFGKPLAYADMSNVSTSSAIFANLANKNMSNVSVNDIANKGIAKNDMSNVSVDNIANKGIAKNDLSNISVTSSTLTSKDIQTVSNKTNTISSSSTSTQYPSASAVYSAVNAKQDKLTAGEHINISNNTISVVGAMTEDNVSELAFKDNVSIDTETLATGQVLTFDATLGENGKWVNSTGGGGTGSVNDVRVNGTSVVTGGVAYVDLSNKTDKITSSKQVYVTTTQGLQSSLSYSETASNSTIAQRDSTGSLHSATPTVSVSDTSTVATTGFISNKFQVVTALPASPDPNVFYFIKEA